LLLFEHLYFLSPYPRVRGGEGKVFKREQKRIEKESKGTQRGSANERTSPRGRQLPFPYEIKKRSDKK